MRKLGKCFKNISEEHTSKTLETISTIVPFTAKAMVCGDPTGSFPYTLARGTYDYGTNTVLVHT